jgi:hypothetical protein
MESSLGKLKSYQTYTGASPEKNKRNKPDPLISLPAI